MTGDRHTHTDAVTVGVTVVTKPTGDRHTYPDPSTSENTPAVTVVTVVTVKTPTLARQGVKPSRTTAPTPKTRPLKPPQSVPPYLTYQPA